MAERKSVETKKVQKSSKKQQVKDSLPLDKNPYENEIILMVTLVLSILLILSNFNLCGALGPVLSNFFFGMFGFFNYLLPIGFFIAVAFFLSNRGNIAALRKLIGSIILFLVWIAVWELFGTPFDAEKKMWNYFTASAANKSGGGLIGGMISNLLCKAIGEIGAYVILFALIAVIVMFITEKLLFASLGRKGKKTVCELKEKKRHRQEELEQAYERGILEPDKRKAKTFTFAKEDMVKTADVQRKKQKKSDKHTANLENETKEDKEEFAIKVHKEEENKQEKIPKNAATPMEDMNITPIYKEVLKEKFSRKDEDDSLPILPEIKGITEETVLPILNHTFEKQEEIKQKEELQKEELQKETVHEEHVEYIKEETHTEIDAHQKEPMHDFVEPYSTELHSLERKDIQEAVQYDSMKPESNQYETMDEYVAMEIVDSPQLEQTHDNNHYHAVMKKPTTKSNVMPFEPKKTEVNTFRSTIVHPQETKIYQYPPIDLLARPKREEKGITDQELKATAMKLQSTLASFGVQVTITNVSCGPTVTRYELQPEQGVKVSKITGLADDIKLNLAAADIRIEAPIPGKAAVGIEVPNSEISTVYFRELMESDEFKSKESKIAFAVGKDIGGQVVVNDIAKMPHLLIAGATGSGKSVCINTLIMSILYKAKPDEVKLIMVDPKVVELSVYNGIPHLLIPVVTDPKKASAALNWAVAEMTDRYNKFAELGVRDLVGYNKKVSVVEEDDDERFKKMPQIVIIVDELADLMMVAPGEVEEAICRLAQLARAAGIHLIIATQRPSVNVITGVIKANVPSRIAFSVSSAIDSRTILDGGGAEKLLGKGDMLFFPSGIPKPVRVQGAFISDQEVSNVVDFLIKENSQPEYNDDISEKISSAIQNIDTTNGTTGSMVDDYFIEAGKFIIEKDKASIGMLQRVYKIGFNRAARIMDQLSEAGVVGPEEGTKPRKVLMSMEEFEQYVDEYI